MAVMAMFPLGSVLIPGGVLPLHVFEPRYRDMIRDCLRADGVPEFGQTLITHGWETGGGDARAMVGTVAQMLQVEALDENRYALVAVGTRRIRVSAWLADDPYPRAEVEDWPDDDIGEVDLTDSLVSTGERVLDALTMAARLGDVAAPGPDLEVPDDPVAATYRLSALAPIGPADRLRLLAAAGPVQRIATLGEILDDVVAMLKFRLS